MSMPPSPRDPDVVLLRLGRARWTTGGEVREYLSQADDVSIAEALAGKHGPMTPAERDALHEEQLLRRHGLYPARHNVLDEYMGGSR